MFKFFTIFGILVSVMIWVLQRQHLNLLLRISISGLLLCLIGITVYFNMEPVTLGDKSWYDISPFKEIVLFIIMLLGMVARYFTKAIDERREKIAKLKKSGKPFKKVKIEFDMWEFSYPLFVSVITFGGVLSQTSMETLTLSNVIISFQTGFFWQTLLTKKSASK